MSNKPYRKFLASAATVTMVASAVAPAVSAAEFKDVSDFHKEAVDFLVTKGANGISTDAFGTNLDIKRMDAAVLLANVIGLDTENAPESGFTDVADYAIGAVNALKAAGITNGTSETTFGGSQPITRGEAAVMIQRSYGFSGTPDQDFEDATGFYKEAIDALTANGITNGISDTEFGIGLNIKRGDFAVLLHRAYQHENEETNEPNEPNEPNDNFELTIMHTNDTHAHLDNVAKVATAVKEVRAENPNALLVSAGDVFSGTLYFNEFQGQADLQFMNLLGYDVMTFGNHEFDLGSSPEGHKALADFIKGAQFPLVSANADFSADANLQGLFSDLISSEPENGKIYNGMVKEVDGEKVGFFGLTTAETADISSPGDVKFSDYLAEAEKAVQAFEGMGVDKIVAVTHIGFSDNANVDNDLTLAAQVDGIDVIVGGHDHTKLAQPVVVEEDENGVAKDPTIIVQANEYYNYLGTLDVEFDDNGTVVGYAGELIEIGEQAEDAEAAELLASYSSHIEEVQNSPIGATTESALENPRLGEGNTDGISVRNSETPLGNLITDGMLTKAKQYNDKVVLAFQNGGGIRAPIDAGEITVGEVITVLPFGNTLATMDLTGAELKAAFEISLKAYPEENGGFLHVSGAKVEFDSSKPAGERVVSISIKNEDGSFTAVEDGETYTIATNAFTAKGGDGYDVLKKAYDGGRATELGLSDWENFAEHLASLETIVPITEGRIVDVAE